MVWNIISLVTERDTQVYTRFNHTSLDQGLLECTSNLICFRTGTSNTEI